MNCSKLCGRIRQHLDDRQELHSSTLPIEWKLLFRLIQACPSPKRPCKVKEMTMKNSKGSWIGQMRYEETQLSGWPPITKELLLITTKWPGHVFVGPEPQSSKKSSRTRLKQRPRSFRLIGKGPMLWLRLGTQGHTISKHWMVYPYFTLGMYPT